MCEPRWRTQLNPCLVSSATTSRGFRTGSLDISVHRHQLRADKFTGQDRLAVLHEHFNNLAQIAVQFIQCSALGVRSGKSRDVAHEQAGVGISLYDCGIGGPHDGNYIMIRRCAHRGMEDQGLLALAKGESAAVAKNMNIRAIAEWA